MTFRQTSAWFVCLVGGSLLTGSVALASSHREAPLIAEDPTVDSTDLYAFVSPFGQAPGSGARVTLLANYIPFQEPTGGPNFYKFSDTALYEIKVDNTGDAVEDIVYQFRFWTERRSGDTFLYNTGPLDSPDSPNLNVVQHYSVTRVDIDSNGDRTSSVVADDLLTAPHNVGLASNGGRGAYEAMAAQAVYEIGGNAQGGDGFTGTRVFVGPRDEGFYIDIGAVFDLLNISRTTGLGANNAVDGTAGFNVSTIAIEVPVSMLTADGSEPVFDGQTLGGPNAVLGVWTTASRRKHRVLRRYDDPRDFGPWVQVSRLGMPLINELVVPLGFKDQFNRTHPADDLSNIAGFVLDPELSRLLNALYSVEIPPAPRLDLVSVISFLPGLLTSREDLQPADLLRLNVSIPGGFGDRLGVIGGDVSGFPNGRRVGDDVVDILERVVGGGILSMETPEGAANSFGELSPNNALNDGVDDNDVPYLNRFPFLGTPHDGITRVHDNPEFPEVN